MTGTIEKVSGNFGFILGDDRTRYFFHAGSMDPSRGGRFADAREGAAVEFEADAAAPRGPRAERVRLV